MFSNNYLFQLLTIFEMPESRFFESQRIDLYHTIKKCLFSYVEIFTMIIC